MSRPSLHPRASTLLAVSAIIAAPLVCGIVALGLWRLPSAAALVQYTPDGKHLAYMTAFQEIIFRDAETLAIDRRFKIDGGQIGSFVISADGQRIVVYEPSKGLVTVLDAQSGKTMLTFKPRTPLPVVLGLGDDLVALNGGGLVEVWDIRSGKLVDAVSFPQESYLAVSTATRGRTLAIQTQSSSILRLFEVRDGRLMLLRAPKQFLGGMTLSADGQLAVVAPYTVGTGGRIVRLSDGEVLRNFTSSQEIYDGVFSADGKTFAAPTWNGPPVFGHTASADGGLATLSQAPTNVSRQLAISPDGERVAMAGPTGIIGVWDRNGDNIAAAPRRYYAEIAVAMGVTSALVWVLVTAWGRLAGASRIRAFNDVIAFNTVVLGAMMYVGFTEMDPRRIETESVAVVLGSLESLIGQLAIWGFLSQWRWTYRVALMLAGSGILLLVPLSLFGSVVELAWAVVIGSVAAAVALSIAMLLMRWSGFVIVKGAAAVARDARARQWRLTDLILWTAAAGVLLMAVRVTTPITLPVDLVVYTLLVGVSVCITVAISAWTALGDAPWWARATTALIGLPFFALLPMTLASLLPLPSVQWHLAIAASTAFGIICSHSIARRYGYRLRFVRNFRSESLDIERPTAPATAGEEQPFSSL